MVARRRALWAIRASAYMFTAGFVLALAWVIAGATNDRTHLLTHDWLWRVGWIAFGLLVVVPFVLMLVMAIELRTAVRMERLTGRSVGSQDLGDPRETAVEQLWSRFGSSKWRRGATVGIFAVIVAYKIWLLLHG